jgi:hypothetical protein
MPLHYLLHTSGARRAFEHTPALGPGWREVSHAEYMAAWQAADAEVLRELRVAWEREAWAEQVAEWRAQAAGQVAGEMK